MEGLGLLRSSGPTNSEMDIQQNKEDQNIGWIIEHLFASLCLFLQQRVVQHLQPPTA